MNRRVVVLLALLAVLALALGYAFWATPVQEISTSAGKSRTGAPPKNPPKDVMAVRLELLEDDVSYNFV